MFAPWHRERMWSRRLESTGRMNQIPVEENPPGTKLGTVRLCLPGAPTGRFPILHSPLFILPVFSISAFPPARPRPRRRNLAPRAHAQRPRQPGLRPEQSEAPRMGFDVQPTPEGSLALDRKSTRLNS